ncbi:ABC transporter ATP-binding protein [Streptomyces sp. NPDC091289]|uniref:ABC transporter ATP-binding protein n=1 Tax=Streptomyces sp. NPDC091289 TaxID=3365989 RepID=UPI003821A8C7
MSDVPVTPLRAFVARRTGQWLPILGLMPAAGPATVAATALFNVVLGLLPLGFAVGMAAMIARVPAALDSSGSDWAQVLTPFGLGAGALLLQQVLAPFQGYLTRVIARRVDVHCAERLMTASLSEVGIPTLEEPRALTLLADARDAFNRSTLTPGEAVAGALSLVARYSQLAGAVTLLMVVLGPWPGLLAGGVALVIRFGQRGSLSRFADLWRDLGGRRRELAYLRSIGSGPSAAKEIRILGIFDWLAARHDEESDRYLQALWEGRRRLLFAPFIWFTAAGLVGAVLLLLTAVRQAVAGDLGLFGIVVMLQTVLVPMRFGVYFPESDTQTQFGLQAFHALRDFEQHALPAAARPEEPAAGESATGEPVPGKPAAEPVTSIRFEGVGFRYPRTDRAVLDGLDLDIPVGRSTAIVGLNGAGKTTVVKLLTKLYGPDSGRLTVDGHDLATIDTVAWQRRLAVIFQDYIRYELSARHNITMGASGRPGDPSDGLDAAIDRAIDRAGARELLDGLPQGLDTVLSQRYEGGQDLSGGQWQRIALARAFHAVESGARVLVLDEPTAQLDVRAENEFYNRFLALTEGLTSVIISHRFSTVRRADHIVVLDGGRVSERGSHDELLDLDGTYAQLFRLQAARFDDSAAPDDRPDGTAQPTLEPAQ